jgi:acyl-CoA dehydrogenase
MPYAAPLDAIRLSLDVIGGLGEDIAAGRAGDLSLDDLREILGQAARFAEQRLAPQNRIGDRAGARFDDGVVTMPPSWREIHHAWAEAGWNGVDLPARWGGMGLPTRLATATMEMWTSACMAFSLGPVLTQGAADTLDLHASKALKNAYLAKLVSGEWTATMNLTEPQAGSDLGLLRTRAERTGDGTYRITGSKIFITCGEHDLSDNIIHLVLARLADAPAGTKGISLFLVPKILPDGARNDLSCTGIEHKLGIHGSPTCSMAFGEKGGATGWLVGEENRGLACMFTMMNKARLFTGLQGVAIAERACQQALAFATARRQGRAAGATKTSPIIAHPDVRRNLMTMRALTAAGRALAHDAARAIDLAQASETAADRAIFAERAGMMTPIVKACCSEIGCEVASLNVQIHGGMGYIEETGAAQLFRDARITPIYEGTNGIQAIDLVTRKVLKPGSAAAEAMVEEYRAVGAACTTAGLDRIGDATGACANALADATRWLRTQANQPDQLLSSATPYLKLFGVVAGMALLAKAALAARRRQASGDDGHALADAIANAAFYADSIAVQAQGLARTTTASHVPPVETFGAGAAAALT